MKISSTLAASAVLIATVLEAHAADPALVCHTGKLKLAGKYAACRLNATAKGVKAMMSPDYSKCDAAFNLKYPATETKAGPMVCPSQGEIVPVKAFLDACNDGIAARLAGGSLPIDVTTCNADLVTCQSDLDTCETAFGCGNGVVATGESCDGADLDGKTCASFGGTDSPGLACTSECSWDFSGCAYGAVLPSRFIDNGDQTTTDLWTGRTWEMKTGTPGAFVLCPDLATCPDPHHVNNDYHWTGTGTDFDGPVESAFLDVLNDVAGGGANCFAGHCDWRLPSALELKGILLEPEAVMTCSANPGPCIDASFPGSTGTGGYWSADTYSVSPTSAYYVRFDGGGVFPALKTANRYARAVRGGL